MAKRDKAAGGSSQEDAFSWLTTDQIYTRKRPDGVSSMEILALPNDLRRLVNAVLRLEPVRLEDLIAATNQPADDVRGQVALLTAQGWLHTEKVDDEIRYRVRLSRRRARSLPPGIWQVLEGTWRVPLFRYFDQEGRADFSRAFKLESFNPGEVIFDRNDWGDTMYIIESGIVELVAPDAEGKEIVMARLRAGDIIGELAALIGERRWATARTRGRVTAWSLCKSDLDDLFARTPAAGLAIRREIERGMRGTIGPRRSEHYNPVLVIGAGGVELVQEVARHSGDVVLMLDLRRTKASTPQLDDEKIVRRQVRELDSKNLALALHKGVSEYDRVMVIASSELHGPLMSIVSMVDLVIDLSGKELPWIIAAARRRWTVPTVRSDGDGDNVELFNAADIGQIARRLTGRVVGLALSGEGARALVNIGVLRAWQEAGLPLDMIAASGIGAVIAGLYASGLSADELADVATQRGRDLDPFDGSLSLRLISRSALYAGKRARGALRKLLDNRTFADLCLKLYVLASEQINGEPVIMEEGSLMEAMEASLAIAGLVAPAEIDERRLVDGGLVSPLPANILMNRGAGVIIGVSAIPHPAAIEIEAKADLTYTWLRLRDQMAYAALMNSLRDLDLLIAPDVREFSALDFDRAADLITIGEAAAGREVEHIKSLIMPEQSE